MEKNYEKMFKNLKEEILDEIRTILGNDNRHEFSDTFYVHYVEGEVANTEICNAVEVWFEGGVVFCTVPDGQEPTRENEQVIEGENVFGYEPNSFIDILNNLKKEIRAKKIARLRELVIENDNEIKFDGNFSFALKDRNGEIVDDCKLKSLEFMNDGTLTIFNEFEQGKFSDGESCLLDEELDRIIAYVEEKTFALTKEQHAAIDEFLFAYEKLAKLKIVTLWDTCTDTLSFLNSKGMNVFVDASDSVGDEGINVTKYLAERQVSIIDRIFLSDIDSVYVEK